MTNSIKTKVLTKFEGSEMICVELEPEIKLRSMYVHFAVRACEPPILTSTEHTSAMSLVNETRDYD